MKKIIVISLLILFIFSLLPVSIFAKSKADEQRSNLTFGMVKAKVIKEETAQNEIIKLFGPPNIITKNKSGQEVWTYDKISSEGKSGSGWGHLIIAGGAFSESSTSSKTVTLMITFDSNDVVKEYSFIQTAY